MAKISTPQPSFDCLSAKQRQIITTGLRNGANRRDIITWLAAGGIGIAAAGSIVGSAHKVLAATPQKGGKLTYACDLHGPSDTLDPARNTSTIDYARGRAMYNSLCQINDNMTTRAELAMDYSSNHNKTEWTFNLRRNVRFHDGSPFTADDVMYSMARHYGVTSKSTAKTLVSDVLEWKKTGNYSVKAIMNAPNPDLPVILGTPQFKIIKDGTADFQNPVGTGPFKLQRFFPGVHSIHTRNDDYWREPAHVEEIEIFAIADTVSRISVLLSGDVDMIQNVAPIDKKLVETSPDVGVWSVPSGGYMAICCMTNTSPGNNHDFVMAMKLLQRRKQVVESFLKNQGTVGNDHPINVSYGIDHCADLPQRTFDLDRARFHLKKSGTTEAVLNVAEIQPGITEACMLLQRDASTIGLDLKINKHSNDGYLNTVWMKTPLNVVSWNMRPTASTMLNIAFAPNAPWNDTLWRDHRMGQWLEDVRAAPDPVARHEIYCAMQTLIHDESGMVIMAHNNIIDGISDKVRGIGRMPLGSLGGYEWPEFAWLVDK